MHCNAYDTGSQIGCAMNNITPASTSYSEFLHEMGRLHSIFHARPSYGFSIHQFTKGRAFKLPVRGGSKSHVSDRPPSRLLFTDV